MKSILVSTRRPELSVYENGRIDISAHAARLLRLWAGDVVDVMEEDGDFFLYVRHRKGRIIGRHEAMVYPVNKSGRSMRLNSRRLASALIGTTNGLNPVRFQTGEPVELQGYGKALPVMVHVSTTRL